ncbi:MAG: sigma-54 dependent transcriptional regulator [Verrucomicrobiae bacterium]|nr:sigma-54 dependent transcriptional regulator [Verrucomicrobiae bacterium]
MATARLLLVDDDPAHRKLFGEDVLARAGYDVMMAESGEAALETLETRRPDLIITDVVMPGKSGMALLKDIVHAYPDIGVILFTSQPEVEVAVEAIKIGALDYLSKTKLVPPTLLADKVAAALEKRPRHRARAESGVQCIVGSDPKMLALIATVRQVADSSANVLICGETGTGKELVARAIHAESRRSSGPFVTLDCATLAPELAESELFGHEKGAFSGAVSQHRGRFERADHGTLFLDEVTNLSPQMQAKLLRVIQTKTFERVGGEKTIVADVRLVAATNRPLEDCVREGSFRRDLYHRLNVLQLRLPPLRERRGDIPALVDCFMTRYASQSERLKPQWTAAALERLQAHDWPGNVRDLENLVYRTVLLCRKPVIEADDVERLLREHSGDFVAPTVPVPAVGLQPAPVANAAGSSIAVSPASTAPPQATSAAPSSFDLSSQVEARDREVLLAALARNRNNLSRTARELQISRTTLYSKLHKYGILPS